MPWTISSVLTDLGWELLDLLSFAVGFGKVWVSLNCHLFHCLHPLTLFLGLSILNASLVPSQNSLQIHAGV